MEPSRRTQVQQLAHEADHIFPIRDQPVSVMLPGLDWLLIIFDVADRHKHLIGMK